MRIAAFDLGSNSFHLIVVEAARDGTFLPLAREKEMLRLGDLVARTGRIGPEGQRLALEVMRRLRAIADVQGADEIVAIGTAALREAEDGGELVDHIYDETGIAVSVVDGVREAELIFRAVAASVLIEDGPALAADLGGGSLELMVGDRAGLLYATSLHLGVGRLTAELVESDPPSGADLARLNARVHAQLVPAMAEIVEYKPRLLIGSSGTFLALARMAVSLAGKTVPEAVNQLTVPATDLASLRKKVLSMTNAERARLPGCDQRRAELVPAGIVVLGQLMAESGLEEITLSEWALREGIVLEAIGAHDRAELGDDPRALRRASVLSLCRRSNCRQSHAHEVARLALALFDATADLHGLAPVDRELLELAALLHDIGEHISRSGHDRHSAYLIENGGLRGFSPDEIRMLAVVARYHIRGTPKPSFEPFGVLGGAERARAIRLTALLRIADALDTAHASRVVRLWRVPAADAVHLAVAVRGEAELEQWMVRRKAPLFERTVGMPVVLEVHSLSRDVERERAGASFGAGLG